MPSLWFASKACRQVMRSPPLPGLKLTASSVGSRLRGSAVAAPVPLVDWRQDDHVWRGSALLMRLALDGAAPLTVAMALDVGQDQAFVRRLGLVLSAYVLLMVPLLALLARWLVRRALRQAVD